MKKIKLVVFLMLLFTVSVNAQPGPLPDPDVPIGGIELLIAAGALFGAKKWFDKSKKN